MRVPTSKNADLVIDSAHTSSDSPSRFQRLRQVMSTIYNDYKVAIHRNNCQRMKKLVNKECNFVSQFLIKIRLSGNNLSGINLQHANLASLPLSRVNLSHAELQYADLNHSKLQNALLPAANLTKANLYRANLRGADLHDAVLCGVDLGGAHLRGANLHGANLSGVNLTEVDLFNVDLSAANLAGANLTKVKLIGAKLAGASFRGANLAKVNLLGVDLKKVDLREVDFRETDIYITTLRGMNLSGANLSGKNLSKIDLRGSNLSGTNLSGADLCGANLSQAKLIGANLCDIKLPCWNYDNLDRYLNHINNRYSLLKTIASIDVKYRNEKIALVHQLINSLDQRSADISLSSVVEPLLDTLATVPYNQDPIIINWLNNNILPLYLAKYDTSMMPVLADPLLATLLNCINKQQELMFSHNGAFIQMISQAMAGDSCFRHQTKTLYHHYLQDNRVAFYTMNPDFGDYAGNPDWSDKEANNFILLSRPPNSGYAMMMSQNQLQQMLDVQGKKADINWHNFYLYQGQEDIGPADYQLDTLFQHHFKLFMANYRFHQQQAKFGQLLVTLQLGELQPIFQTAITKAFCKIKLIDFDSQTELATIFNDKFEPYTENGVTGYRLTADYTQQLLQAYHLSNADKLTQAQILLSLAAVFSKYSSSAIFGTETESPNALRYFAFALMEKAHQLSPPIFRSEKQYKDWMAQVHQLVPLTFSSEEQYKDWCDRLLGYNNVFSCTAVLSTMMVEHIKNHFPILLSSIMPPAWN
ncbi:pentapeptide repeat-containing protein [Arsenophonus sp. aPb]|uniref:pentapeptide repeat-containing protein n=1 Tax=Arsenophonus sp. aPb TaxID=3041619 RepID=UPI0024688EF6|nr:pentapeptide repeat-containing protein [Arsenophonus sp. aPb]WGL97164.1 pentapeptide repeat-containing protein [Arsenophonus sp. aPb]